MIQWVRWVIDPLGFLDESRAIHGDLFRLNVTGMPPAIFLASPDAIQSVFTADPSLFDTWSANRLVRPLVGNRSLFLLDGADHQRQRKLLMPSFHGEQLRAHAHEILEIAQDVINHWETGRPVPVIRHLRQISMNVILRVVFGVAGDRYDRLQQALKQLLGSLDSPVSAGTLYAPRLQVNLGRWSPWGRFLHYRSTVSSILYEEIRERRSVRIQKQDILGMLIDCRDEQGEPLSDQELHDSLLTLLVAGYETTATVAAWALYWIHCSGETVSKLRNEIGQIDYSDPLAVLRLPYLNAVTQESLRIGTITPITTPRILKQSFNLMGEEVAAGTALIPCIYLLHRNSQIYPDPERFNPDRFFDRQFSPFEYIPFGGANRRCIGATFASFELKLILASVLSSLELELNSDKIVEPVRSGFLLTPRSGVEMTATHRTTVRQPATLC